MQATCELLSYSNHKLREEGLGALGTCVRPAALWLFLDAGRHEESRWLHGFTGGYQHELHYHSYDRSEGFVPRPCKKRKWDFTAPKKVAVE